MDATKLKVAAKSATTRPLVSGRGRAATHGDGHDELGIVWPRELAPYDVHLVAAGKDDAINEATDRIADELEAAKLGNVLSPRTRALFYATDFYDQLAEIAPTVDLSLDQTDALNSFTEQSRTLGEIFGKETEVEVRSVDPLSFPEYPQRLKKANNNAGEGDAIMTAAGTISWRGTSGGTSSAKPCPSAIRRAMFTAVAAMFGL